MIYYKALHDTELVEFKEHGKPGFMTTDKALAYAYLACSLDMADEIAYLLQIDVPQETIDQLTKLDGVDMVFVKNRRSYPVGCYSTSCDSYSRSGLYVIVLNASTTGWWKVIAQYDDMDSLHADHGVALAERQDRNFKCRGCGETKVLSVDDLIEHKRECEESLQKQVNIERAMDSVAFCHECK